MACNACQAWRAPVSVIRKYFERATGRAHSFDLVRHQLCDNGWIQERRGEWFNTELPQFTLYGQKRAINGAFGIPDAIRQFIEWVCGTDDADVRFHRLIQECGPLA